MLVATGLLSPARPADGHDCCRDDEVRRHGRLHPQHPRGKPPAAGHAPGTLRTAPSRTDQLLADVSGLTAGVLASQGDHRFVFQNREPVYLLAVSDTGEPVAQLAAQMDSVYDQIVSLLTATRLNVLKKQPQYDIKKYLIGAGGCFPIEPVFATATLSFDAAELLPPADRARCESLVRQHGLQPVLPAAGMTGPVLLPVGRGRSSSVSPDRGGIACQWTRSFAPT